MIRKLLRRSLVLLPALLLFASCIPNKKVVYFQDKGQVILNDSLFKAPREEYRLLVGDIINVSVKSLDPALSEIFNMATQAGNQPNLNMSQGMTNGSDIFYLSGYPVNVQGYVELPVIGAVSAEGKTLEEVSFEIKKLIEIYIKDPFIEVKLGGIRFTALGEFANPGRYGILQSDVTIYEAVANAGDLTVVADRRHAILIRQYPDGERIHQIDLTQRDLIKTPFYYIQPNDLLYLPPLKVRALGTGQTGAQTFATIVTALTAIALIVNLFGN